MKRYVVWILIGITIWWGYTHIWQRPQKGTAAGNLSNGEKVDLKDHLEPDKHTIFFFYADW